MPTNCITKSFTLVPGESFVLPVGAEVLSISDQTSVTSSCVDLTNLEQQKCYVATLGAGFGNIDRYFLGNHSTVIGIMYNGLYTPFLNNTIYTADSNALFPQLSSMMIDIPYAIRKAGGDLIGTATSTTSGTNGNRLTYILIKTIPSVANKLGLRVRGISDGTLTDNLDLTSDFLPIEAWQTAGYANLPTCV